MRINEIIREGRVGSIQDDVADALPATYAIPDLQNQDPYKQYRFGVALAAAKGSSRDQVEPFEPRSKWGENAIVVAPDEESGKMVDQALKAVGISSNGKRLISTPKSEESKDVATISPVAKPKRNKYGV
jgi:hypothetical protein